MFQPKVYEAKVVSSPSKMVIKTRVIVWISGRTLPVLNFVFKKKLSPQSKMHYVLISTSLTAPKNLYCQGTSPDERTERAIYIFFGCFFTVPMLLVIFCYGSIYRVVKKHNTTIVPALQSTNYLRTISAQEIKTSRVIFAAVLGYCVCWTPLTFLLFLVFGFQVTISPVAQWVFVEITTFSSWINPIIYGVMNRSMRREFRNIVFFRK